MGIREDYQTIFSDTKVLADFIRLRINSPTSIETYQLAEVFGQNNKVTELRTYDEWKEVGRQVCRGEKGYSYFDNNSLYKNNKSYVFDLKQTKGHTRKPVELTEETLEKVFNQISEVSLVLFNETLDERKNEIYKILGIRRKENGKENVQISGSIDVTGRENLSGRQLDDRTTNGNRRISPSRKRTSIGEQLSFLEGIAFENEQIWITSGRISNLSQLQEIHKVESTREVGDGVVSVAGENREVRGRTLGSIPSTEERGVYGESNAQTDVSVGDGASQIHRVHSSVRYRITDEDFIHRGPKERCHDNIKAIRLVKTLEKEERMATEDEQKILARYVGWGGLAEAFDENNSAWKNEYIELKEILTEKEYNSARGSVLNAHFTPKGVIDGIYAGIKTLGVKQGRVLESSCGTGNFIGCAPDDINLQFEGVEIDYITSQIAKNLYPTDKIDNIGFEEKNVKDGTYDLVIGNVPFGDYKVYDSEYIKHKFLIHDYFIAKSLDKLKANGVMAVITGKGTLDKLSPTAREYFAQRAKLLGAYRLPNTAFKSSAGTEVVADILFFQKRDEKISLEDVRETETWIKTVDKDGIRLNQYFIDNPDHVIGEFKIVSGPFGQERTVVPSSDNLSEQLKNVITESLPNAVISVDTSVSEQEKTQEETPNKFTKEQFEELGIGDFNICLIDNKVYVRENLELIESSKAFLKKELSGKRLERVKAYIELRNTVKHIVDIQCEDCSDEELRAEQVKLNNVYDNFVKDFGYISTKENSKYFEEDIDFSLVLSIEDYDEEENTATKQAIFNKRTIRKPIVKTHTDDIFEALSICKSRLGEIDLQYITQLTSLSVGQVIEKLKGQIYRSPDAYFNENATEYDGWVTREEFLSGDVVSKLENANYYKMRLDTFNDIPNDKKAQVGAELDSIIKALEDVQPTKIKASDIRVRLGATWVETIDYTAFISQLLGGYGINVMYSPFNGQYSVSAPAWLKHSAEARNIYGTERMNAIDIFEHALNNRTPTITDAVEQDGKKKRVVNKPETAMAREKVREMNELFSKWLWDSNEERREKYEEIYNRKFNSTVLPTYSGEHLTFEGMNAVVELRPHQKDAVARISDGKNTLLHHSVGAGKTFEIIAGAMKLCQYGLANKPMIVVPNPLVSQWARDVKFLYPNAKVLVTSKEQFEKNNRKRFLSKIATGDWDMVIVSESQFVRIPVSQERQLAKTEEVIDRIKEQLYAEKELHRYRSGRSLTIKTLESILKKKETKYKELQDKINKVKDNILPFEKLGVDYLFVDEAHLYKNKEIETCMTNVAGITSGGSSRAFDLEMKIDYLSELHGGDKGVVFATGTPISNSMAEMFTMQSYLQKNELIKKGINYFDAWASNFGEVVTSYELNTSGQGVKTRTRFSRFVNLPELQKMYRSFADVKTAEMLDLPVPKANRQTITIPATDQILMFNEEIIERGQRIEQGGVDPSIDNMLKLSSDGKKLALDPRCLNEDAIDEDGTKVNVCVNKVFDIYENTKDEKLTQVIFCDQSTPKEIQWNIYQDIKDKLMALGVSSEEIAFIHDADTDEKKEKLFSEINAGSVCVLIGSTQKCGVGANFQKKLKALHHLDVPYRPADMEQREGRIIRQGNKNEEVDIYSYITEKTFDSYSYQILETKQRFISQINKGDMTIREASDIDEQTLSFAQIKAIATANPDFLRQMELVNTIKELRMLKSKFYENKDVMKRKLYQTLPEQLAIVGNRYNDVTKDVEEYYTDNPLLKIDGVTYTERADAGKIFPIVFDKAKDGDVIGEYGGLKIVAYKQIKDGVLVKTVALKGNAIYYLETGDSGLGNITRIINAYDNLPKNKETLELKKNNIQKQIDELKANIDSKWDREDELYSSEKELAEIESRLQGDKEIVMDADDSSSSDKEESANKEKEREIENEND